jgi:aminoglycoside/choline kinase family phosphotransferase
MPEAPASPAANLADWARGVWPGGDPGPLRVTPVAADGSPRLFVRLAARGLSLVAMSADNPAENRAWLGLARHLAGLGLPVARVLAHDLEAGRFLMADLGELSLQEAALATLAAGGDEEALLALYHPVLGLLARLQSQGARGLDLGLCFDGPELTPEFLLTREAGYFLEQFVAGACGLGQDAWPPGLRDDLALLCQRAGQAQPRGLTHRDFQSRNLVLGPSGLGLVDFQGARLGPAQYDLASLLHDPYVALAEALRERLLAEYLDLLAAARAAEGQGHGLDRAAFLAGWPFVAASRLMQALGAYAFLTRRRGRPHFAAYAVPALAALRGLIARDDFAGFTALRALLAMLPAEPSPEMFQPLPEG